MRVRYSVTDHSDSKKYKYLLLLPLLLSILFLTAQQKATYSLKCSLPTDAALFTTDKLQNTYIATSTNQLLRYDSECQERFQYNNYTLGNLQSIDVSNPLNIILFYPEFQSIIVLDRTLNFSGEVNLLDLGLINVSCIGSAVDNNIWVYDDAAFSLKKISQGGTIITSSNDLSLELPTPPSPIQLIARENSVYLNDPKVGILMFNQFGQYQKTIPITHIESFQVIGEQLIFQQDQKLFSYDPKALKANPIPLPEQNSSAIQWQVQKNRLYLLDDTALHIYRF
ncbi:MAG: hypothetical protein AAF798_21255, partial [Bacteroidota bacterium]